MRIEIEASTIPGQTVIQLHGKIDANTTMIVEQALLNVIGSGQRSLVLDCAQMDFISSAGLKSLIMAIKKMKVLNGTITLVALQKNVKDVLAMSGLLPLFIIQDTRADADKYTELVRRCRGGTNRNIHARVMRLQIRAQSVDALLHIAHEIRWVELQENLNINIWARTTRAHLVNALIGIHVMHQLAHDLQLDRLLNCGVKQVANRG